MAGESRDLRQPDLRTNILENPYWITSGPMDKNADDKIAIFFSFPITASVSPGYGNSLVLFHEFVIEVTTGFTASVTFNIGQYTIATDAITTGEATSDVGTPIYYHATDGAADITSTGFYVPDTSCSWLTARAAGTWGTNRSVIPVDGTVLCIGGALARSGDIAAGELYLHALISVIPAV